MLARTSNISAPVPQVTLAGLLREAQVLADAAEHALYMLMDVLGTISASNDELDEVGELAANLSVVVEWAGIDVSGGVDDLHKAADRMRERAVALRKGQV